MYYSVSNKKLIKIFCNFLNHQEFLFAKNRVEMVDLHQGQPASRFDGVMTDGLSVRFKVKVFIHSLSLQQCRVALYTYFGSVTPNSFMITHIEGHGSIDL